MPRPLWKWSQSSSSHLNYSVPDSSSNAEYNGMNSCGGGGDSRVSWSCPHMMLLSPDMQYAAQTDNIPWALYGVAGIGQSSDCGKCYQLQLNNAGTPVRTYIVQAVNTGSDVSSGQFDVLVGAGGFGIFNGCASDCKYGQTCSGGHCNYPQYTGNFQAWTPDGNCYGGGVHDPNGCNNLITTPSGQQSFAEETLIYGCKTAIQQGYHQNFKVNYKRVACPRSLYLVTGIKSRNDDALLDQPSPFLALDGTGQATTTMDCCKPTCAWRQNIGRYTVPEFPSLYVCDKNGYPLTN
ncbi:Glycoside hydrolase family 45 protein [Oopsacas minuta]|uniref:cellulase n=1 Tax=Oopsacas minuta TaxID=111878 RepID=A0AAV7J8B3_9METZ|nr:Glycoside hydrolase family 45 protein [Oopsacas minuta]